MKSKSLKLTALATTIAMVGLMIASDALALPDTGYRIIYFSGPGPDATIVGKETLACNGHYVAWGVESEYSVETDEVCNLEDPPA